MKKIRVLTLVCFFSGLIAIGAFAQDKSNRAEQVWTTSQGYWTPVYCDGVQVDELSGGEIVAHYVFRMFKNGDVMAKQVAMVKGMITSDLTGEVFMIREIDKYEYVDHWVVDWHYNLIGDQGSHYTGWLTYDYRSGEITVGNTTCN